MKIFKSIKIEALLLLAVIAIGSISCKKSAVAPKKQVVFVNDSITKNGITLIFINRDTAFQLKGDSIRKGYESTFFTVYPKIMAYFNPDAPRKITFIVDPTYKGIAGTGYPSTTSITPSWALANPTDWNMITHEVTHDVQQYKSDNGAGWLVEGIADYSKGKFGVPGKFGDWYIPDYNTSQKYTDGYTTVARFILWAEAKYNRPMVQILDKAMRAETYNNDTTWQALTGSTFDQLWNAYTEDPYFDVVYRF